MYTKNNKNDCVSSTFMWSKLFSLPNRCPKPATMDSYLKEGMYIASSQPQGMMGVQNGLTASGLEMRRVKQNENIVPLPRIPPARWSRGTIAAARALPVRCNINTNKTPRVLYAKVKLYPNQARFCWPVQSVRDQRKLRSTRKNKTKTLRWSFQIRLILFAKTNCSKEVAGIKSLQVSYRMSYTAKGKMPKFTR